MYPANDIVSRSWRLASGNFFPLSHQIQPQSADFVAPSHRKKSDMKKSLALAAITLLSAADAANAQFGAPGAKKGPVARAVKSDVKYIKCEVCEQLAEAAHGEYLKLRADEGQKLRETTVIEKMEKMCDVSSTEGDWIVTKDLQEKGTRLRVVDMGKENYGECGVECKTIVKACEDILGPRDTDVGEYLFTSDDESDGVKAFQKWLCEEETSSCSGKTPALPKDRPKGEKFKKRDKKDLEMERLMKNMQGMPGMGGAQMFSRDQMLRNMGGGDDDDDDDESPYGGFDPSSFGSDDDASDGIGQKLGDLKDKAASTAKSAWNTAKGWFGKGSSDEEEEQDMGFSAEELSKEEL
jgi:hypothetical protein